MQMKGTQINFWFDEPNKICRLCKKENETIEHENVVDTEGSRQAKTTNGNEKIR